MECYFSVRTKVDGLVAAEQDLVQRRCQALAEGYVRERPTLPAAWESTGKSYEDTGSRIWLPHVQLSVQKLRLPH